jgi:hypothetical protein
VHKLYKDVVFDGNFGMNIETGGYYLNVGTLKSKGKLKGSYLEVLSVNARY